VRCAFRACRASRLPDGRPGREGIVRLGEHQQASFYSEFEDGLLLESGPYLPASFGQDLRPDHADGPGIGDLPGAAGDREAVVLPRRRAGLAVQGVTPVPAFWRQWSAEFAASRPRLRVTLRASPPALAAFGQVFGQAAGPALEAALPPDEHGWRVVTLSFEHELAASHRLAGFGDQVEVLSPAAVRARLVTTARQILRRYDAADPSR
jgi:hypothetical protein